MVSRKTLEFIAKSRAERDKSGAGQARPKMSKREKTFEQWKEYGKQFSEDEKKSYVKGYNHAIQDILRLAHGGAEARLVRNYVLRDVLRAVVEASVQCGIDAAADKVAGCKYNCECYNSDSDLLCEASMVHYPCAEDCCSVKSGIPAFEEVLESVQSAQHGRKKKFKSDNTTI